MSDSASINATPVLSPRIKVLLAALLIFGVLWWNWRFSAWTSLDKITQMNDVPGILQGYHQTPNLLKDGLQWWHGPWIQQGIQTLRPVSSYGLWLDSFIGLRFGFFWVGVIGVLLLTLVSALSVAVAWQWTRSPVSTITAALLAPAGQLWNFGGTQPQHWLVWFPVHHDLWMIACLLGALLGFDLWIEKGLPKYLYATWACFVVGALSKEFLYIFPVLAGLVVLRQRFSRQIEIRVALRQVVLMLLLVVALYCYRTIVLPNPYNPHPLKRVHFLRKPFLYWFGPFYIYVLSGTQWYAGLALLLFVLGGTLLRWKQDPRHYWLQKPGAGIAVALIAGGIIVLYCQVFYDSFAAAFWHIFEPTFVVSRLQQLAQMILTIYSLYLLWKYRRDEPTLATWLLMAAAYGPVWTYLGWHYTLTGWFVRSSIFWPLIAKLAMRDLSGYRAVLPIALQQRLASTSTS